MWNLVCDYIAWPMFQLFGLAVTNPTLVIMLYIVIGASALFMFTGSRR